MIERQIETGANGGATTTFVVHPERGGPHPMIVFLMDAPAIREELRDMARRLGTMGYYVMLPNLYWRAGVIELGPRALEADTPERARMGELMNGLSSARVMDDFDAMLAFADADPAARADTVGTVGYCMSGRFAIRAAGHRPDRVKATASIYGVRLVTDRPDSPHRIAKASPAEFYFACAETDHWAPPEMVRTLMDELAGADGEVELYPGVEHGFAFPQRRAYDKAAAERHWERLAALFRRRLG
ncbi:MAG TPA: dienelactone hydrolase family protein [Caulobacteraceae bacterium]|nr:dienelactone hydrolase family protein [Caulobacteraceae bacterium]